MKTQKENAKNLATPGKPMSEEAFNTLIKEAEKGPFLSLEESKKHFKEWGISYSTAAVLPE
jgi:hypothetical protein